MGLTGSTFTPDACLTMRESGPELKTIVVAAIHVSTSARTKVLVIQTTGIVADAYRDSF